MAQSDGVGGEPETETDFLVEDASDDEDAVMMEPLAEEAGRALGHGDGPSENGVARAAHKVDVMARDVAAGLSPEAPGTGGLLGKGLVALGTATVLVAAGALRKILISRRARRQAGQLADSTAVILEAVHLEPPPQPAPPKAAQHLRGLRFVASDVFAIAGHTPSLGLPEWKENTEPAKTTAPAVDMLVQAGAELVGVANVSSDFLSLQGRNSHYGTAPNPAAPGHITGGFHSGAAAAVAAGLADFALATEGFGGLRVPTACCGLWGYMASPQAVPEEGVWNAAVNTAAVGWITRSADLLPQVGQALLLGAGKPKDRLKRVMIAEDLFSVAADEQAAAVTLGTLKRAALAFAGKDNVVQIKLGELLSRNVPALDELGGPGPFENLQAAYTIVAAYECAKQCTKWSDANEKVEPTLQDAVNHASQISEDAYKVCVNVMQDVRKVMYLTLNGGTVLAIPTIGTPTIKWSSSEDAQQRWAVDAVKMCALAPMAACPQVTMPAGTKGGVPLSVSFIAQHNADAMLLAASEQLAPMLLAEATKRPEPVRIDAEEARKAKAAADLERRRERAESYKAAGNAAFKEAKFEAAIREYGRAIETDPKQATYYSNRAMAYLKVMNFQGAELDCCEALKLELSAKTLLRRGTARLGLHDFEGSSKDFKQVVAIEPNNRQARIELKNLKEMKARFDEMEAAAKSENGGNNTVFGSPAPPPVAGGGLPPLGGMSGL